MMIIVSNTSPIMEVKPIMDNLREQVNFRISSQLYADVLMAADESVT